VIAPKKNFPKRPKVQTVRPRHRGHPQSKTGGVKMAQEQGA